MKDRDYFLVKVIFPAIIYLLYGSAGFFVQMKVGAAEKPAFFLSFTNLILDLLFILTTVFGRVCDMYERRFASSYWSYTLAVLTLFFSTYVVRVFVLFWIGMLSRNVALYLSIGALLSGLFLGFVMNSVVRYVKYRLIKHLRGKNENGKNEKTKS